MKVATFCKGNARVMIKKPLIKVELSCPKLKDFQKLMLPSGISPRLSERYSIQVLGICQDKKIQHSSVRDDDYYCLACTSVVQYLPHAFRRCSILATKDILNKNEVSSPILKAMSLLYEDGCGCEEGISHFKSYYVFYGR